MLAQNPKSLGGKRRAPFRFRLMDRESLFLRPVLLELFLNFATLGATTAWQ